VTDTGLRLQRGAAAPVLVGTLHRVRQRQRARFVAEPPPGPVHRPARIALMLALAHKVRHTLDRGDVHDQAEIARRLGCTPARITHLLDLTLLAPAIQEHLLALEAVNGREPTTERALRRVTRAASWQDQWAAWCKLGLPALPRTASS
jgi:hypothetical protein